MRAWQGVDNYGNSIKIIYYGYFSWPSYCAWMIPGVKWADA